jgi:ribulose 1,5-bisphosphate synthetase/thiazole synthase
VNVAVNLSLGQLPKRKFDVVIVGAGGSGMRPRCGWRRPG